MTAFQDHCERLAQFTFSELLQKAIQPGKLPFRIFIGYRGTRLFLFSCVYFLNLDLFVKVAKHCKVRDAFRMLNQVKGFSTTLTRVRSKDIASIFVSYDWQIERVLNRRGLKY